MFQFPERAKLSFLIAPATLAADNTPAAVSIERYECARVIVGVGVGGITFDATNKLEIKLREGDGTVGNHTAVDSSSILMPSGLTLGSGGIIRSLVAAHAAATIYEYDYIGAQTYLSALADFSGTHGTGTPLFVALLQFRGALNPPV